MRQRECAVSKPEKERVGPVWMTLSTKKGFSCGSTISACCVQKAAGAAAGVKKKVESVFEVRDVKISLHRHEKTTPGNTVPVPTKDNSPVKFSVYIKINPRLSAFNLAPTASKVKSFS